MDPDQLARHLTFLQRQPTEHAPIGSWVFPFFIDHQFPALAATLEPGRLVPDDIRVEPFLQDVDRLAAAYRDVDDDYPLSLGAFYGVPWMEAIMGCPVSFSGDSIWAEPAIADWSTHDIAPPDLDGNPWLRKLLELLDALVAHADGRYFCSPTLMRGMADICVAMRGANELPVDVLECPDNVRRLATVCADVWVRVARAQLARIPNSDCGYVVGGGCMRYWAPDRGVWLQDDAFDLLSPEVYREIFLPHVRAIAGQFVLAFHLHGVALWPVDMLLEIEEIDVLQLTSDGELDDALGAWKKIQARKPCIAFVQALRGEQAAWDRVVDELSPVGLSLQTFSPTLAEARTVRDFVAGGRRKY